ncbi:conserved protein of unknown function [Tenacibaculum sp. 190130A14a]|uniref:Uncharacterized protein n=1 Tax=Tenacibaculum polynesiense TaxID=3137857 RepID=A0ABM9PCX8_9FLAO
MDKSKNNESGVKRLLILLGLLILSPLVISFGIKALRAFANTPKIFIAYILVTLGVFLILYTVYFGIKTFKTILDLIFNN